MNSKFKTLGLLAAASLPILSMAADKKAKVKKNILFIAVDDLKPLLNCYGDPVAVTPNIDALAKRGVLFTHSYCQQAVSGPSRSSLLTGMCPDRTKVWDLKTLIRKQNPNVVTLPQYFSMNGYQSTGIGKIYDTRSVDKQADKISWSIPFVDYTDYYDSTIGAPADGHYQAKEIKELADQEGNEGRKGKKKNKKSGNELKPSTECLEIVDEAYSDGAIAAGAIKMIQDYNSKEPFFMGVGFKKPHLPFVAPKKYWDLYKRENMPLASYRTKAVDSPNFAYHNCGELRSYTDIPPLASFSDINNLELPDSKARELIHGYYAAVSYMDAQLGKVLQALDKKGCRENTIIVLFGDHGWHLGDHGLWNKHTNFEQAAHTPLLIIDPSIKPRKVESPVEFLDIYPTLCDLAGIDIPKDLDGTSLQKLMKGEVKSAKPYAVSQYPRVNKMGYSIRTERYRYTIWVEWKNKTTNVDNVYAEELYDYEKDPLETKNLINDNAYKQAAKLMREYWKDYQKNRIK